MSMPYDLVVLVRHYLRLCGARGLVLLADRAARRILPALLYRPVQWLGWGLRGPKTSPGSLTESRAITSLFSSRDRDWFDEMFPGSIQRKVASAEMSRRHEFELLGTGLSHWGDPIDWHRDVRSGHTWPVRFFPGYGGTLTPGGGADVKVPWELSRLHHLVSLAQAWWLTQDRVHMDELFDQWESWLASNRWPHGVNWTVAMEAGIRAVNLLWATSILSDAPGWNGDRETALSRSLHQHGTYIEHNLEVSSRGGRLQAANHYLANLTGLACLGMVRPDLPQAARWTAIGLNGLEREIRRQVLPKEGFFFESSTGYHRLALELFLVPALLARRTGNHMSPTYWKQLEQMCEVVLHVTGPDGQVPQIGDGDDGRLLILAGYPDWPRHDYRYLLALGAVLFKRGDFKAAAGGRAEELYWLLGREGVEAFDALEPDPTPLQGHRFEEAGLYTMRSEDSQDFVLIRGGGPSAHSPTGHSHSDLFSLELWSGGRPVIVDPGTYVYTSSPSERNAFRSTASHNTVKVDGKDITAMSGDSLFRMGKGPNVSIVYWDVNTERSSFVAEHDAFAGLSSPVRLTRKVVYHTRERAWEIEDALEGRGRHQATWFWHLAPGPLPEPSADQVQLGPVRIGWWSDGSLDVKVEPGRFSPSYGRAEDAAVLVGSAVWEDRLSVRFRVDAGVPVPTAVEERAEVGGDS